MKANVIVVNLLLEQEMGKTKRKSANARQNAYDRHPTRTLRERDWFQIRFTQQMIHPTFSNVKDLTVFDMYFALRYGLIDVSDIPPIRVFEDETGQLWSVDNRRLWVMKNARRGFNCEPLYTREQNPGRFKEVEYKIRSLQGKSGDYVWFRSREAADAVHQCCITASKRHHLDDHITNDHLNITSRQLILLTRCPIHYKDRTLSCSCLTKLNMGTLKDMIHRRCLEIERILNNAHLTISEEHKQLFEKFNTSTTTSSSNEFSTSFEFLLDL